MFNILVVDDDKNTRMYFEAVLKSNGYTVTVASDGYEAFEMMDKEHIDLVVLDIMMPKLDGYELTRTLRECDNNLPILLIFFDASLWVVLMVTACVVFMAVRHFENFKRLIQGKESRISFKK